jgi:hypothetical protein
MSQIRWEPQVRLGLAAWPEWPAACETEDSGSGEALVIKVEPYIYWRRCV